MYIVMIAKIMVVITRIASERPVEGMEGTMGVGVWYTRSIGVNEKNDIFIAINDNIFNLLILCEWGRILRIIKKLMNSILFFK